MNFIYSISKPRHSLPLNFKERKNKRLKQFNYLSNQPKDKKTNPMINNSLILAVATLKPKEIHKHNVEEGESTFKFYFTFLPKKKRTKVRDEK